jgi:hypothetical protein
LIPLTAPNSKFVIAGQKREARLRARRPGNPSPSQNVFFKKMDTRVKPAYDELSLRRSPCFTAACVYWIIRFRG